MLRSAGLPKGALIQFRYDERHLGPGVRGLVDTGQVVGKDVLIAYSDQSAKDRDPEMLPCRYAVVASFEKAGTTVSLKLRLLDHAFSDRIAAFNTELKQLSAGLIPKRVAGKISGCYFTELNAEPRALVRTSNGQNWQTLIDQLADRVDFQIYDTFLLMRSIVGTSGITVESNENGQLQLKPDARYTIKVYQYHPNKIPAANRIEAASASSRIHFLSDPILVLDSRYDHKEFLFETTSAIDGEESTIKIIQKNISNEDSTIEYDVRFSIAPGWGRAIAYAVLIALLLAAPHFTTLLATTALNGFKLALLLTVAALSSIGAALIAVFKIRRIL